MGYKRALLAGAVLAVFATAAVGQAVGAVSPSGYLNLPNQSAVAGPLKSGTFGNYTLPGKGQVKITYEDVLGTSRLAHMENGSNPLTANYLSLGFNDSSQIVPTVYFEQASNTPASITFSFDRPTKEYAIGLYDIDMDEVVTMNAVDESGNIITNFSGWSVLGTGDATVNNPPGGTDPAPVPLVNMPTGTFTSSDPTNTNRSYVVFRSDVALSELSFTLVAPTNGTHVYASLYSYETPDMTLGNYVWNDQNNNGLFDVGEQGIDNVLVELLDEATGTVLETAATSGSGYYEFTDLEESEYRVRIAPSNFQPGGALEDFRSSLYGNELAAVNNTTTQGTDRGTEAADVTVDGVTSGVYNLLYDGLPETDGDSDRSTNMSVWFGFVNTATEEEEGGATSPVPQTPEVPLAPDTGGGTIQDAVAAGIVVLGSLVLIAFSAIMKHYIDGRPKAAVSRIRRIRR